ncbi:hypothetical protein C9J85_03415 [Haloferax sp. wsp5]|nr:hypothetical protein C9J85_03415 [Haloferax sp. wsp5]
MGCFCHSTTTIAEPDRGRTPHCRPVRTRGRERVSEHDCPRRRRQQAVDLGGTVTALDDVSLDLSAGSYRR